MNRRHFLTAAAVGTVGLAGCTGDSETAPDSDSGPRDDSDPSPAADLPDAVALDTLATGLERGVDRSLVGYRVGRALLFAVTVFCLGVVGTRLIV